jgi:tRNA(fMet)-specific endonuclease VapC
VTTQAPVLLDTDTLSAILRRNPVVTARAQEYLSSHRRFAFSIITRYAILRGLKARRATKQQAEFDRFCAANTVLHLSDAVVVQATEIYANLYWRGRLIGDADILIAATSMSEGFSLATNNERHFERIEGLDIDNWLRE